MKLIGGLSFEGSNQLETQPILTFWGSHKAIGPVVDTFEDAAGHITDGTGLVGDALGNAYEHAADKATARTVLSFLAIWECLILAPFSRLVKETKRKTAIFEGPINLLNVCFAFFLHFRFLPAELNQPLAGLGIANNTGIYRVLVGCIIPQTEDLEPPTILALSKRIPIHMGKRRVPKTEGTLLKRIPKRGPQLLLKKEGTKRGQKGKEQQ